MISFKQYDNQLTQIPIENYCFSLTGGLILLDTNYVEKLICFSNESAVCSLASILFEKSASDDLKFSSSFVQSLTIKDVADLLFILYQYLSFEIDKKRFLDSISGWLNKKSNVTKEQLKVLIRIMEYKIDRDEQFSHFIIFSLLQSVVYKKIKTHDDYLNYFHYVKKFKLSEKYYFSYRSQQALLNAVIDKHYPSFIPQLCHTRLAYLNDNQVFFPDCCTTTIRNIINTLIYDEKKQGLDVSLLENVELNIDKRIIAFYKDNSSIEQIQLQSVHNYWADSIKGLNKYDQSIQYNTPTINPYCELKAGATNILKAFYVLFSTNTINAVIEGFNKLRRIPIQIDATHFSINSNNLPDYENKIILKCEDETLEWYFLKHHFRCKVFRNTTPTNTLLPQTEFFNWFAKLLRNQDTDSTAVNWDDELNNEHLIFNYLTYSLKTPDNLFSALNNLLNAHSSVFNENTIKTATKIFNAIPNDPYHLYNKYLLIERAQNEVPQLQEHFHI